MPDLEKIFFEIHKDLPQEGPGSDASTLKALQSVEGLSRKLKVLDIGCGPGRQTLALANALNAEIIAVDNHQLFLDDLNGRLEKVSVKSNIETCNASMDSFSFAQESFDLIWSEGAAYIMGVDKALKYWKPFLKRRGYIVITELSWLKDPGGNDAWQFFSQGYPAMRTVKENLVAMKGLGYQVKKHFVLPKEDWFNGYYNPIEKRIAQLEQSYAGDQTALAVLEGEKEEIGLYRKFSDFYGYVFFVLQVEN